MDLSLPPELEHLVTAARAGSAGALNTLFETVRPCLAAHVRGRLPSALRSRLSGSDVVQETLTAAWLAFPSFAGSTPAKLLAWLLTIQRNAAGRIIERHTAQKRGVGREQPLPPALASSADPPSQEAMFQEAVQARQQALERLPPDMREVIELRTVQGLSYAEAARRLERSEEAVRKLHARALLRWQELTH